MSSARSLNFCAAIAVAVLMCMLSSSFTVDARTLTSSDVANIESVIATTFGLAPSYGTYCNSKISPCPLGDNTGALVRLAFHDAAGNGGANGCIDFVHTSSNNGLQNVVTTIDTMYYANGFDAIISKADLYVLAANLAVSYATTRPARPPRQAPTTTAESSLESLVHVEAGPPPPPRPAPTQRPTATPVTTPTRSPSAEPTFHPSRAPIPTPSRAPTAEPSLRPTNAPNTASPTPAPGTILPLDPPPYTLNLPFRYGRVDSATCDDTGALPGADFTWNDINNLFGGRFGMNIKEVVAILGAHSVGRCRFADSGFDGGWTSSQSSFSNSYYKAMGNQGWNNNNKSDVWVNGATRGNLMLMADVELLFDTDTNGKATCNNFNSFTATTRCPLQSQSNAAFLAYANNIEYFFANFSTAWPKMTEFGFGSVVVDVDTPLADPTVVYPSAIDAELAPTMEPTNGPTTPGSTDSGSGSNAGGGAALVGMGIGFGVGALLLGSGVFYFAKQNSVVPMKVTDEKNGAAAAAADGGVPSHVDVGGVAIDTKDVEFVMMSSSSSSHNNAAAAAVAVDGATSAV